MRWPHIVSRQVAFLAALCLALSGIIAVEIFDQQPTLIASIPPTSVDATPESVAAQFTLAPLAEYAVVIQRPVFSPSRRPGAADDPDAATTAGDMALTGIVISGGERIALIRYGQPPGKTARVRQGQNFNGWVISAVAIDRVALNKEGGSDILMLNKKQEP